MNRHPSPGLRRALVMLLISVLLTATSGAAWAREAPPEATVLAPQSVPEAPNIRIARVSGTNNVRLTWDQVLESPYYQVWRGTAPYFDPFLSQGNQIADVDGQPYGSGTVPYVDDGVDRYSSGAGDPLLPPVQVLGVPAVNYFWVVRGRNSDGVSENSNRVGEFDFALVPGS